MTHKHSRRRAAACCLAACALLAQACAAGPAQAQTAYPQVMGPGGSYVPPQPTALVGLDSVTGAACVVGASATCQLPTAGGGVGGGAVTDSNSAAFAGFIAMTIDGATYAAGRSFQAVCTASGAVKLTATDTSTAIIPLQIGLNIVPYAITSWTLSGVTGAAACSYANLK